MTKGTTVDRSEARALDDHIEASDDTDDVKVDITHEEAHGFLEEMVGSKLPQVIETGQYANIILAIQNAFAAGVERGADLGTEAWVR